MSMDEMEEYRDRIERSRTDRRQSKDRRETVAESKLFDVGAVVELILFLAMLVSLWFWK